MPEKVNLAGRRFGRLLVLEPGPVQLSASGRKSYPTWRCRCDCGAEEVIRQVRLPYADYLLRNRGDLLTACSTCSHTQTCSVCGAKFVHLRPRGYCSDACHTTIKRSNYLNHYYRLFARDPDLNRKRRARLKERAAVDPAVAERIRQADARKYAQHRERMRTDPVYAQQHLERARERYRQEADVVQARRRARLDMLLACMTEEQLEAWRERHREYNRRAAARKRSTPEGRERYREYMRAYERERALRRLATIGDQLMQRHTDEDDDEQ